MEATQKLLKGIFKALEKSGEKKLYREAPYKSPLAFDEALQMKKGGGIGANGEPGGIYYANHPYDIPGLRSGAGTPREESRSLYKKMPGGSKPFSSVAVTLPGARHKTFDKYEWEPFESQEFSKITPYLKKRYDFVTFPDTAAGNPEVFQTVQLNPRKAIVNTLPSWKGKGGYSIVGLGGLGLVAGDMLSPNDADAMPLGKQIPGMFKNFKKAMVSETKLGAEMKKAGQVAPAVSGANARLKGMELRGGKISGVYQGIGDSRYIHMEDGRIFPTDRDSLHELAAERGTQVYVQKFGALPEGTEKGSARWAQILKSYEMNQLKGTPSRSIGGRKPDRIRILEDSLTDRQNMIGSAGLADQVLVQDNKTKKWWLWPRVYAEPAEAAGLVRIDKGKNTLFTNKGLK